MAVSQQTVLAIKSYENQAEVLVQNYLLADPFIPYTSVVAGILACKLVCLSIFNSFLVLHHHRF